LWIYY